MVRNVRLCLSIYPVDQFRDASLQRANMLIRSLARIRTYFFFKKEEIVTNRVDFFFK